MTESRHTIRPALATALAAVAFTLVMAAPAFGALPDTSNPTLQLERTIRTTPFAGSSESMRDNEGSAYVARDDSLWLADDNGKAVYEVNPTSGALKRKIPRTVFNDTVQFGGGPVAGSNRTNDFEAIAYDSTADILYVFSGPCCTSGILPTVFRLTRMSGSLQVESYQPLASGSNDTAAAWNPADGTIYVGHAQQLRSYDYVTNSRGPTFSVGGLAGITGMDFSGDGADLFVVTSNEQLLRVRWSTKTLVSGWTFDLRPFNVLDSRAVALISDRFFVSDGAGRTTGDPLRFAVFVFGVQGSEPPPPPPSGNLVGNPGFEVDTAGWSAAGSGNGVRLERVTPGRDGSAGAAHLVNGATGNRKCVLNDDPNWVTSTSAGTYTASIWVMGETAGATIKIKVFERNGSTVVGSRAKTATLTTSWTQITVARTIASPGSSLDLQVFVPRASAPPGTCFFADDASITV